MKRGSHESLPETAEISQRELGVEPTRMGAFERNVPAAGLSSPAHVRKEACLIFAHYTAGIPEEDLTDSSFRMPALL